MKRDHVLSATILIGMVLFLIGAAPSHAISWRPDRGANRVILIVNGGWFGKTKELPLSWRFTKEYESEGEMAWCAQINREWKKVYPFGEDQNEVLFHADWLSDSSQ